MHTEILAWGSCLTFYSCVCVFIRTGVLDVPPDHRDSLLQRGMMNEEQLYTFVPVVTEDQDLGHHSALPREHNPTDIMERFEKLEIFQPLKGGFQDEKNHRNSFMSRLVQKLTKKSAPTHAKKLQKLLDLAKAAQSRSKMSVTQGVRLENIVRVMTRDNSHTRLDEIRSRVSLFVITALEDLQREDLTVYERLWNLTALHTIQSFHPDIKLQPVKQDLETGPVSRGGLELFLTKGLYCEPKEVFNGKTEKVLVDKSVREPLERAELIVKVKKHLWVSEALSPTLIQVYNRLLQTRAFSNTIFSDLLSQESFQRMMSGKNTPIQEIQCWYHILQHLGRYDHKYKKLFKSTLTMSKHFKVVENIIKGQAKLQPYIEQYINQEDRDPYIANLYLSLKSWNLCLDFLKGRLNILHIQDSALKKGKAKLYGLDETSQNNFSANQDAFIRLLYTTKFNIQGLEKYLDSQVKMDTQSKHYEYSTTLSLENEEESHHSCPICLTGFLHGERVINLRCHHTHIFHQDCIMDTVASAQDEGKPFKCPTCRRHIELPFTHAEYISFDSPGAHLTLGSQLDSVSLNNA